MGAINSLSLSHFKAFDEEISFSFDGKNTLVFGENGSGKTSVFEGLKLAFFYNKLEAKNIPISATPEDAKEKRRQLYESYRNAQNETPFSIKIDGIDYGTLVREDYKMFLVTHDDFELEDNCILLQDKLGKLYFDYGDMPAKELLETISDDLVLAVNKCLVEQFSETISLSIDKGDRYRCILSDIGGKLNYGTRLSHYFNEGKIHLILIIIYINVFLLLADNRKKNVLVLDDFITSLDATNRAFVLRFLFRAIKGQQSLQVLIFTHNVSFYNLTKYYIKKYLNQTEKDNWTYFNLYNLGDKHMFYPQDDDTVDKVEADFKSGSIPLEDLGNRIRQLFEIQVHELAKIIISGGLEESNIILERLTNGKPVYYKDGKNVYDLVKDIENYTGVEVFDRNTLSNKILTTINEYKNDSELKNIRDILKHMTLFQKVSLHPTSHGVLGLTPVSQKELQESIQLVKQIENCIKNLKDKDVINM